MGSYDDMTEEETKLRLISPILLSRWNNDHIEMERPIDQGRIGLENGRVRRSRLLSKPDYVLRTLNGFPIAVIEAKKYSADLSEGMGQAETYASKLDSPFAYSTNGKGFKEYDAITGCYSEFRMEDFPTEKELIERYLSEKEVKDSNPRFTPFFYSNSYSKVPRYYQRIAVDRVVDAVYNGQKRMMIVLATGTGKTFIAMQILYKLMVNTKTVKRALYLVDRNSLADQPLTHDFKPIGHLCNKITKGTMDTSHPIQISLYQQMSNRTRDDEDGDCVMPFKDYDPDYFDFIIVDECHRGSAKEDSRWREILEYFSSATQLGMTATPREDREVSNSQYFGAPIYTYSYRSGVEDGFLAPFHIVNKFSNIEQGLPSGTYDRDGQLVDEDIGTRDYDRSIVVDSRTKWVAKEILDYMAELGDMYAKTIVFCEDTEAAERTREAIRELVPDLVKQDDRYVVRITGNDQAGRAQLGNFAATGEKYPVIATTSEMLSTGVDTVMCKIIAINKNIASLTEFRQIIGRGSRINEKRGKMYFTLLDFKNVTQIFNLDLGWDGPPMIYEGPTSGGGHKGGSGNGGEGRRNKRYVDQQLDVFTDVEIDSIYSEDGISIQDVRKRGKDIITNEFGSLDNFINRWTEEDRKSAIIEILEDRGLDLEYLRDELGYGDLDSFDIILNLAYSKEPLSKSDRARNVMNDPVLSGLSDTAKEIVGELMELYRNSGQEDLSDLSILNLPQFERFGSRMKIVKEFGGRESYKSTIRKIESVLYS